MLYIMVADRSCFQCISNGSSIGLFVKMVLAAKPQRGWQNCLPSQLSVNNIVLTLTVAAQLNSA